MNPAEPHFHRCRECNAKQEHGCIDRSCAEGVRWVIMCLICWERLVAAAGEPA